MLVSIVGFHMKHIQRWRRTFLPASAFWSCCGIGSESFTPSLIFPWGWLQGLYTYVYVGDVCQVQIPYIIQGFSVWSGSTISSSSHAAHTLCFSPWSSCHSLIMPYSFMSQCLCWCFLYQACLLPILILKTHIHHLMVNPNITSNMKPFQTFSRRTITLFFVLPILKASIMKYS